MATKVGVMLSGCGVFDGSEIHEAVSVLIALDKRGAQILCMAPNIPQTGVVNHFTRQAEAQVRRVLDESARIARGNIRDAASVTAEQLDALILPGGFGAAKNLCSFATDGPRCQVNDHVQRLLVEMHKAHKPIGLACIAPVIAARVFGARGLQPTVTIGTDKSTADAVRSMNARHQETDSAGVCIDELNLLVTTPCYMTAAGPYAVFQGADKMVEEVLRLAARQ